MALLDREAVAAYLDTVFGRPGELLALRPLKDAHGGAAEDPKGFGYGGPLEVEFVVDGALRHLVIARTRPTQGFGHDYPADRAWQALYGHHAYNGFPRHVRSVDVACVRDTGEIVSVTNAGEFVQLVERAEGTLYWLDLDRLLTAPLRPLDVDRARALGRFLAETHAARRDEPTLYARRIRELVGHGECLMGILDSYPHPYAFLPPTTCEGLERDAVSWRWRLRGRAARLARTHGDFHPWNLLFRAGVEFSVLDRSRGEWGEPADDVSALGINYLFFGLRKSFSAWSAAAGAAGVAEPFPALFRAFMSGYLDASADRELLEVIAPFIAFRALVVAHPRWYPTLEAPLRARLLRFARDVMTRDVLSAESMLELLEGEWGGA
jgi:hypothetical protein